MAQASPIRNQFLVFAFVGALATALQYLVVAVGLSFGGQMVPVWSAIGYFCGSLLSYLLNRQITFQGTSGTHGHTLLRFYMMVTTGCLINSAIISIVLFATNWSVWYAQIVATVVTIACNFTMSKNFVFRSWP